MKKIREIFSIFAFICAFGATTDAQAASVKKDLPGFETFAENDGCDDGGGNDHSE